MLEAALAAGRRGRRAATRCSAACCRRPGAALLVRRYGFDLAAVVSASHNPYRDNGIKFFGPDGTKISDEPGGADRGDRRGRRRAAARAPPSAACASCTAPPATTCASSSCASATSTCPAGACCSTAPTAPPTAWRPRSSAAWAPTWTRVAVEPDGRNINDGVRLDARRRPGRAGGRRRLRRWASPSTATATACWPSTATGAVVDGDELIALAALHLREAGPAAGRRRGRDRDDQLRLPHGDARGRASRWPSTPVGDRHVLAELLRRGWALGGEQSGHIIDTGLRALGRRHRRGAADARGARRTATWPTATRMEKLPQRLVNVTVARPRRARRRARRCGEAVDDGVRARSRAAAACWCGPRAPSRWCG